MPAKSYLYDGIKAIPMQNLPPEAWTVQGEAGDTALDELYAAVAFLNRGVAIRANDIASLPWAVMRNDNEVWTNEDPEMPPDMEPFRDLIELIWRTEESLCLSSEAFWHQERNNVRVLNVRWLDPDSMTAMWGSDGIEYYERRIGTRKLMLPVEDVAYVWLKGKRETQPRKSPALAALAAAKVISNTDTFTAAFFDRGAVKASVLNIDLDTSDTDRDIIKRWWKRLSGGVNNAFSAEVIRGETTVTQVGEGVGELNNTELTREKREDILTALGIPHSIGMSNAANYATAQHDDVTYYRKTIVPEAELIERQLNDQLFGPIGLSFKFKPQELSVFQEDEEQRAQALVQYVNAGYSLAVASAILGIQLPEGMDYADLDAMEPEPEPEPPVVVQPVAAEPEEDEAKAAEIATFERWASKRTNPDIDNFKSDILSRAELQSLLEDANGEDAPFPGWESYP